jgi:ADP-ribosylglycohydrolase
MIGAIIGDVIGSIYEFENIKSQDFELFSPDCSYTDDSVLTIATARAILDPERYVVRYKEFGLKYDTPVGGYGSGFRRWLYAKDNLPYMSCGNGSAMRVSPVGYAFNDVATILDEAQKSAEGTHNHPEGIKGAQATAIAIYMGRKGYTKPEIKTRIEGMFEYDLDRTCDEIRPTYEFEGTCQKTVPEAIIAFLESTSFESAIRLAVSLGGDSDTLACITGGIAQAFYKHIPKEIVEKGLSTVPPELMATITEFNNRFKPEY